MTSRPAKNNRECRRKHREYWQRKHIGEGQYAIICRACGAEILADTEMAG